MAEENYAAARKLAREWVQKSPSDGDAYYYLGETFYFDEKIDSAAYYYNRGSNANAESAAPQVGLGKLLLDKGQISDAEKAFGRALRVSKKSPAATYALIGQAYLSSQRPDSEKALANFTSARDNDTKNPRYFMLLGDAQMAADKVGDALTNYEFAGNKDAQNPEIQMKIARAYLRNGIKDIGQQKLEEVISRFPNYPPAYKDLYELYFSGQMYSKGTPLLAKYVSLVGNDIDARSRLARFLVGFAKDYDNGLKEAQIVLSQDPQRTEMYRWLARSFFERGQFKEAYDASKTFLDKGGSDRIFSSDYEYLAKAAAKVNEIDIAVSSYHKVMEMDSSRKEATLKELARMLFQTRRYADAQEVYQSLADLGKANSQDYFFLGQCYAQQKNYVMADSVFKKYTELNPGVYNGWQMRARMNNAMERDPGKLQRSKPYYEKIIEILSADPKNLDLTVVNDKVNVNRNVLKEAYNYLTSYYTNVLQDYQQALGFLEKFLVLEPANTDALANKQKLLDALK
jgi:tetratricopeptide (TPR) repeat protein